MITHRRRTSNNTRQKEEAEIVLKTGNKNEAVNQIFINEATAEMTCRDRTNEFMSTVKNMQVRLENGFVAGDRKKRHVKDTQEWKTFMLSAKQIGKAISSTFTKLEKFTILAKKKSLFDDRPIEIQELTYIIKQDIGNLNKQIAELQEVVKSRNHKHGKHMQSHSNSVVVLLQSKLASMSNDFKQVLECRTENLKHQKNRREQFSEGIVSPALPANAFSGHAGSVLLSDEQSSSGEVAINMDAVGLSRNQQQQMLLLDEQDSYIQSRADTMQTIESTIVELGSIFQQLAEMVKEQEEMVQRIDANVEDTHLNVEAAHSEILKYFQSVTSNRWLMVKIFAVLIIFFIVFVVFIA